MYWCNKDPQSFEGGNLILGGERTEIEYKNNRLVIVEKNIKNKMPIIISAPGNVNIKKILTYFNYNIK